MNVSGDRFGTTTLAVVILFVRVTRLAAVVSIVRVVTIAVVLVI
jgi:hypothetical protein